MTVSVIMGAYNDAERVGLAVQSLQEQTVQEWELIVVDDGSTDHTAEVLLDMARSDSRIRVLRNARNLGLASSLNRALEVSHGELVARMDQDDRSVPDRLERQRAFLLHSLDVDVLGGGAIEVTNDGRILGVRYPRETHDDLIANIYKENPFIHPTVMARRSFWVSMGGYDPQARFGEEDYDLWLRGRSRFRYHNLQAPLIYYRRRPLSLARALASFHAIWRAVARDGKVVTHGWYALRPLVAFFWYGVRRTIPSARGMVR
jgi:glycosyltransferase EpsE